MLKSDGINIGYPNIPWYIQVGVVIIYVVSAIFGTPFLYDERNSGRYLISVIRNADSELFQGDEVADALARFRSGFYDFVSLIYKTTHSAPESLETIFFIMYLFSKGVLILSMFSLARTISNNFFLFVLLGAWVVHNKVVLPGASPLFMPMMRHTEFAIIAGLAALLHLFQERYTFFWGLLSIALLAHFLVGIHLFISVLFPLFLFHRPKIKVHFLGVICFAVSIFIYLFFMSPPPMSGEEAQIFLSAKGNSEHISFLHQSVVNWAKMMSFVLLALLSYRTFLNEEEKYRILTVTMGSGVLIGLLFSGLALLTNSYRLAQLQPIRIFTWVTFFAFFLIAAATAKAFSEKKTIGIIFIAFWLLTILNSLWAFLFCCLGITYLLLVEFAAIFQKLKVLNSEFLLKICIVSLVVGMFLTWGIGDHLPFEAFRSIVPMGVGVVLVMLTWPSFYQTNARYFLVGITIIYSLIFMSLSRHEQYAAREDFTWDEIRIWIRENTSKDADFLLAGGGENFRAQSFRSSLGKGVDALVWVSPSTYLNYSEQEALVTDGFKNNQWDLPFLFSLAREWEAEYVLVDGPFSPKINTPVVRIGGYRLFEVP